LAAYVLQRSAEQVGAGLLVDLVGKQPAGCLGRDVDSTRANLVHRVALGLGDLLLGHGCAAGDVLFRLLTRLGDQAFSLPLGSSDDVACLALGFLALALVLGQQ